MIYVITGPDTYRSRQKLAEIIAQFRKKNGGSLNLEIIDAEEDDVKKLIGLSSATSLFQEKKLIVIERVFSSKNEYSKSIKQKLDEWKKDPMTVFLFWDREISGSQKKEFDLLSSFAAKKQEFKLLSPADTKKFVSKEALARGLLLTEKEKENILNRFHNDLWAIASELDKRALGASDGIGFILEKEEKLYYFLDALIEKKSVAIREYFSLLEAGKDEFYIFASIVNSFRNLLLIRKYLDNSKALARIEKESGVPLFVFKKLVAQARLYRLETLVSHYKKLMESDLGLKGGGRKLEYVIIDLLRI